MTAENETFLTRWSRVKTETRRNETRERAADRNETHPNETHPNEASRNEAIRNAAAAVPVIGSAPGAEGAEPPVRVTPNAGAKPPDDLPAVESLDGLSSDYRGFLRPGVDDSLRRDALKKLFADPHFNAIDPFEAYSGDYTQGEPIDAAMMRTLEHAKGLLFNESTDEGGQSSGSSASAEQAADTPVRTGVEAAPVRRLERDGDGECGADTHASAPVAARATAATGIANPGIAATGIQTKG